MKLTGSMLEMEDEIQRAVNEVGMARTREALGKFEATGLPIVVGTTKMTTKGKAKKEYETPYGCVALERHVYQSSKGGETYCPLDDLARIVVCSTPRFAKIIAHKYASLSARDVSEDLEENHGRAITRGFVQNVGEILGSIAQVTEEGFNYEVPKEIEGVATIAISLDGTCMLMKEEGYREAMTGNLTLYDKTGERLHSIYIGAAPEYGKKTFVNNP